MHFFLNARAVRKVGHISKINELRKCGKREGKDTEIVTSQLVHFMMYFVVLTLVTNLSLIFGFLM